MKILKKDLFAPNMRNVRGPTNPAIIATAFRQKEAARLNNDIEGVMTIDFK